MRLGQAVNVADLRALAKRRLPRFVFDYVDGGAEDERTLAGNRAAFESLRFAPRTLVDVSRRDLSCRLLGATSKLPVVVGYGGSSCHFHGLPPSPASSHDR